MTLKKMKKMKKYEMNEALDSLIIKSFDLN